MTTVVALAACVQVVAAAPDMFAEVKLPWLPEVKNPCYRDSEGRVRCLPYLSIIGVSKCGTTDLYKKLMLLTCGPFHDTLVTGKAPNNAANRLTAYPNTGALLAVLACPAASSGLRLRSSRVRLQCRSD